MDSELSGNLVIIKDNKGMKFHEKSYYGNIVSEGLQLSLIEALYLAENERITVSKEGAEVSIGELFELLRNEDLLTNYMVFSDLRNRGYIVKTGFKYGAEFRLYERGKSPGNGHSNYLVKVLPENYEMKISDFSSYVRVAHGVNKKLLFAIVDEENDITYYDVEWTRP